MNVALDWTQIVTVLAAICASVGAWRYLGVRQAPTAPQPSEGEQPVLPALTFDFDAQGAFMSANEAADHFQREVDLEISDWAQFRAELIARFPDLPARICATDTPKIARLDATSPADPAHMALETHPDGISAHLYPTRNRDLSLAGDAHYIFSQLGDLSHLRAVHDAAPNPVWLSLPDGRVVWSNAAFKTLDQDIPKNTLDPGAPLFQLPDKRQAEGDRISLRDTENNRTYWFNVIGKAHGDGTLNFAYDIQDVVKAEAAQYNFVQTLAKTFAHLATGLAVFDRNRQLVLFNPALVDLTKLPADFLIGRPNLFSFFDQLRNSQIMPEPKDYASWRERIADVIAAASDGSFVETWALPCGQTYRITGRPHPDGAIAFLVEDISAEISLTRHFRSEMAVTQSALNALPDSLAIFSATGAMVQCNARMMREWDLPEAQDNTPLDVKTVTHVLQKRCLPSPVWGDVRDCILGGPERADWTGEAMLKSGDLVEVHVSPIASGASLVTLHVKSVTEKNLRPRKTRTAAA